MSDIEYEIEMALLHLDQDMDAQEEAMLEVLNVQTYANRCEIDKKEAVKLERLMTESMRKEHHRHWKLRWEALKQTGCCVALAAAAGVAAGTLPQLGGICLIAMSMVAGYCLYTVYCRLIPEVRWFLEHREECR